MLHGSSAAAETVGDLLLAAASETTTEAFLVAPFVKAAVVVRLFARLPAVVSITLVSRWRPEEIALGVSDLEVWDLVKERSASEMLLEPTLHAKYFRFDSSAFIGSANLTAAALGWRTPSNLELLEPSDPLVKFERYLRSRATPPTDSLREAIAKAAEVVRADLAIRHVEDPLGEDSGPSSASSWVPETRHPGDLYLAYVGDAEDLAKASRDAARRDLASLELPAGLSHSTFESLVGARLLTTLLVGQLDVFLADRRRFGEVRDYLAGELSMTQDQAERTWQTLMRWLLHFLPSRYEATRPHHSEGLRRVTD